MATSKEKTMKKLLTATALATTLGFVSFSANAADFLQLPLNLNYKALVSKGGENVEITCKGRISEEAKFNGELGTSGDTIDVIERTIIQDDIAASRSIILKDDEALEIESGARIRGDAFSNEPIAEFPMDPNLFKDKNILIEIRCGNDLGSKVGEDTKVDEPVVPPTAVIPPVDEKLEPPKAEDPKDDPKEEEPKDEDPKGEEWWDEYYPHQWKDRSKWDSETWAEWDRRKDWSEEEWKAYGEQQGWLEYSWRQFESWRDRNKIFLTIDVDAIVKDTEDKSKKDDVKDEATPNNQKEEPLGTDEDFILPEPVDEPTVDDPIDEVPAIDEPIVEDPETKEPVDESLPENYPSLDDEGAESEPTRPMTEEEMNQKQEESATEDKTTFKVFRFLNKYVE